jgi:hypothetical protein
MRVLREKLIAFWRIWLILALPGASVASWSSARAHEFADSPFVTEARQGRFPFLGIVTYHCGHGGREVICSGQGFLVSRCIIMTSDHVSRGPVDRRYSPDGLTKMFRIQGMTYPVVPLNAGPIGQGSGLAEDSIEDWGLMRITASDCPGSRFGWAKDPTLDPARMPIGTDIAVYTVEDPDFSRITVSRGKFFGKAPDDVLMMASASMRPGQSGGIVIATAPDGAEQVIGMVQGANFARYHAYKKGLKAFSPDVANLFTNIFNVLSESPAANMINQDRRP